PDLNRSATSLLTAGAAGIGARDENSGGRISISGSEGDEAIKSSIAGLSEASVPKFFIFPIAQKRAITPIKMTPAEMRTTGSVSSARFIQRLIILKLLACRD